MERRISMKAKEIHEHLKSVSPGWVDWTTTVDGFKYGEPESEVKGVAVGWIATLSALQKAHDMGCDIYITHEPTFYALDVGQTISPTIALPKWLILPGVERKRKVLDELGMVLYRCHDTWDDFPQIGILDSWTAFLGLKGDPVQRKRYYAVYQVGPTRVSDLAKRIASKVKSLGQPEVHLIGDANKEVRRLAIGTGAITDVHTMYGMGADVLLTTDDGISFWQDGSWALDLDIPLLVVNHCTAELPGLRNLAEYLRLQFPGVKVDYIDIGCLYSAVR